MSGRTSLLTALTALIGLSMAQTPIICEDNISGQPAFRSNAVPCLLGCGIPLAMATGGLLPGSVNETDIPYCELNCVRSAASPAQSSAAPGCHSECTKRNSATPEQLGWCMYWCVQGGDFEQLVVSTTCVPSIEYVPATTQFGTEVVTYERFSNPAAWTSWYATQTAIPRTSLFVFATPSPGTEAASSMTRLNSPTTSLATSTSVISSTNTRMTSSAAITHGTALGQAALSSGLNATAATTTSMSGSMSWSSAWPALAIALLFAVACF